MTQFAAAAKYRMFPPNDVAKQTLMANGTRYHATPGSYLDVNRADAGVLEANGWACIGPAGTARPEKAVPGDVFMDTASGPVFFDGKSWRTYEGASA